MQVVTPGCGPQGVAPIDSTTFKNCWKNICNSCQAQYMFNLSIAIAELWPSTLLLSWLACTNAMPLISHGQKCRMPRQSTRGMTNRLVRHKLYNKGYQNCAFWTIPNRKSVKISTINFKKLELRCTVYKVGHALSYEHCKCHEHSHGCLSVDG